MSDIRSKACACSLPGPGPQRPAPRRCVAPARLPDRRMRRAPGCEGGAGRPREDSGTTPWGCGMRAPPGGRPRPRAAAVADHAHAAAGPAPPPAGVFFAQGAEEPSGGPLAPAAAGVEPRAFGVRVPACAHRGPAAGRLRTSHRPGGLRRSRTRPRVRHEKRPLGRTGPFERGGRAGHRHRRTRPGRPRRILTRCGRPWLPGPRPAARPRGAHLPDAARRPETRVTTAGSTAVAQAGPAGEAAEHSPASSASPRCPASRDAPPGRSGPTWCRGRKTSRSAAPGGSLSQESPPPSGRGAVNVPDVASASHQGRDGPARL
jgi:hypothetical protein